MVNLFTYYHHTPPPTSLIPRIYYVLSYVLTIAGVLTTGCALLACCPPNMGGLIRSRDYSRPCFLNLEKTMQKRRAARWARSRYKTLELARTEGVQSRGEGVGGGVNLSWREGVENRYITLSHLQPRGLVGFLGWSPNWLLMIHIWS